MNLYSLGPPQYTIGHTGTNNSTRLQRIIQPWNHTTVTWNNQPLATTQNMVTLSSNAVTLQMDPMIYIPSAFAPDGVIPENKEFLPKGLCISSDGYSFSVFNRYGQGIFHTSNPKQGWDGTYYGKRVEEGINAYIVNYTRPDGRNHIKSGTVTLIR